MSYVVLARKWRPQGFSDLVGQESVAKTFSNALASEKIVHAYLFSGPRGVGKTSSARILSKALNCINRTGSEPCGTCDSCVGITEGSSVDVIEIDGASNTSVDSVRELRESVKYAPSSGRYKIYIIDEVHMLSTAAFNALLKTLEEPPSHVVFIFATTEAKKIPTTILSRCQHHSFRRITKAEIHARLAHITGSENIKISESALDMIAKAADGSMRDALTLLDQAFSFTDDITEQGLQDLLGLPETEVITNLSKTILSGDISSTLSIVKELTDRGSDLRQLTKELVEQFRNLAVLKITADPEDLLEFSKEEIERLRSISSDISIEQLTLLLTEMLKLETEVKNAINPRYTLELGLLRTSFIKGMTSIESILKMIGGSTDDRSPSASEHSAPDINRTTSEKKKTEQPQAQVTEANDEVSASPDNTVTVPDNEPDDYGAAEYPDAEEFEEVNTVESNPAVDKGTSGPDHKNDLWNKLLKAIESEDHRLSLKLAEAVPVELNSNEFVIGFRGGLSILADSIKSSTPVILPILQNISGKKLKLTVRSLPKEAPKRDNEEIKEEIFNDPLVSDALRRFGGSMIKIKAHNKG